MRFVKLLLLFILSCQVMLAGAVQLARIRTGVSCDVSLPSASCGDDISYEKARNNKVFRLRSDQRDSPRIALTDHHICERDQTLSDNYYWAPPSELTNGKASLATLIFRAKSGKPFYRPEKYNEDNKEFSKTSMIVESDTSTDNERHLALCEVTYINGKSGPPYNCVTVAILTPRETLLRAGFTNRLMCHESGAITKTGALRVFFNVTTANAPEKLVSSIIKTLSEKLELETEQEISKDRLGNISSVKIRSSSALRNSKILERGWREVVDFDIDIEPRSNLLTIHGVGHVLVCRQALGSLFQYNGLDNNQQNLYLSAFHTRIEDAIKAMCTNYKKIDSSEVNCD
jgi:hypothetical protein